MLFFSFPKGDTCHKQVWRRVPLTVISVDLFLGRGGMELCNNGRRSSRRLCSSWRHNTRDVFMGLGRLHPVGSIFKVLPPRRGLMTSFKPIMILCLWAWSHHVAMLKTKPTMVCDMFIVDNLHPTMITISQDYLIWQSFAQICINTQVGKSGWIFGLEGFAKRDDVSQYITNCFQGFGVRGRFDNWTQSGFYVGVELKMPRLHEESRTSHKLWTTCYHCNWILKRAKLKNEKPLATWWMTMTFVRKEPHEYSIKASGWFNKGHKALNPQIMLCSLRYIISCSFHSAFKVTWGTIASFSTQKEEGEDEVDNKTLEA